MIKSVVLVFCAAVPLTSATAQEIVTDRPDFTESAVVVPSGWLQFESGFTFAWERNAKTLGLPELLMRYGLTKTTELRLGLPNYSTMWNGDKTSGFGDTYVGVKIQLGPLGNGDDFALIPALFVPTGDDQFTSDETEPELKVCWSRDLTDPWSISAMAAFLWPSNSETEWLQTIALSRAVTEESNVFLEYAGTFTHDSRPDHIVHVGFAKRPNADSQFDIHAGMALNGSHRRPFLAAGYSWRFGV